jgi:L-ascorbate metabolism protein UlaG (beta-lactamase superfamily)
MFVTPQQKIYYSGDSGYGPHFKAIGEQFGEWIWRSWKTVSTTRTGNTST